MSNLANRLTYETLKGQYAKQGISTILTESSLKLIQDVTATKTSYTFDILTNDGTPKSNEIRLNNNDSFHCTSWSLSIANGTASDDPSTFDQQTYPSEGVFTNYTDYNAIYQGVMSVTVNNVKFLQQYSAHPWKMVPQTQRLSTAVNQNFNQVDWKTDTVRYLANSITFSGARKNELTLVLPEVVTTPNTYSFICLELYGIVAIGGSIFQS